MQLMKFDGQNRESRVQSAGMITGFVGQNSFRFPNLDTPSAGRG